MSEHEIPVSLTVREIRALAFSANLLGRVLEPHTDRLDEPDAPIAAESAAMKLELTLVQAGEPVS